MIVRTLLTILTSIWLFLEYGLVIETRTGLIDARPLVKALFWAFWAFFWLSILLGAQLADLYFGTAYE